MIETRGLAWKVESRVEAAEQRLVRELGIAPLVAAMLVRRGWSDPTEAHKFLNPSLADLHDPALLPDYALARDEILGARERGETIFVHGDYDVDGVTSAAIFDRFLRAIGCNVVTHVPHRMKEGYGIHASAVDAANEVGAKLFLTCDCGIGAFEQVEAALEFGMRVVVTDHHEPRGELPRAHALMNPHREDATYPWKELSGAGVVLKLCAGLTREIGMPVDKFYRHFLDLAALGTIADVMPLQDENRIIAKFGLERLTETTRAGLVALKRVVDLHPPVTAYHVGFVLGPRLNAAGRIADAAIALDLLLEKDPLVAATLAKQVDTINSERKAEQDRIAEEAIRMVQEKGLDQRNVILVGHESWHAGVVGIVASRLVEVFGRPAFVATRSEDGRGKASGRSIAKFNLAQSLQALSPMLEGGGHAMAAGCSFDFASIDEIGAALHEYAGQFLTEEDFKKVQVADIEVSASEITQEAVRQLSAMEPFGCANPAPVFVARQMTLAQIKATRKPAHKLLTLKQGEGRPIQSTAFNLGERLESVATGTVADVLFQPKLEPWNGSIYLKWHVKDFQPTD